ncbi:uncharacterized protein EMH_0047150 [Eimeria mitis]|uniref:Uncharacterized protein n=1 Tax=Eimeria mitis TaxID=44415 RepID=U6K046_9EIME|nr:uncharacterized protein EMH_0047150 [Eimeria mitis]CDJ29138.1 hypothetical protein EMH_0047150 [Eimeria mitis]
MFLLHSRLPVLPLMLLLLMMTITSSYKTIARCKEVERIESPRSIPSQYHRDAELQHKSSLRKLLHQQQQQEQEQQHQQMQQKHPINGAMLRGELGYWVLNVSVPLSRHSLSRLSDGLLLSSLLSSVGNPFIINRQQQQQPTQQHVGKEHATQVHADGT